MRLPFKLSDILISVCFLLLLICAGLVFAVNFRHLYYNDIETLNIPAISGLDKSTIRENYDALIDYCSPFFRGDLKFPSLPSSANGLQHFVEVKNLFSAFYILGILSFCILILIVIQKKRKNDYNYLLVSSIGVLILPLIAGVGIALNFNASFELFHRIFFRNDYWIFSPTEDPVITILPETYFMHCALIIIGFLVIGSLLLYLIYRKMSKKKAA